jgi:phosphoglycerate dehydrogenase-like enzyme
MSNNYLIILLLVFISYAANADVAGPDAATQTLIDELGLREASVPSRGLEGWKKPEKVVIRLSNPEQLAAIAEVAPNVELIAVSTRQEALAAVPGADALIGFCNQELLEAGDSLHWVQIYSAGAERCTGLQAMQEGSYVLTNGQHIGSPALAETSIALMMALVRGLDLYYQNQLKGEWVRDIGQPAGTFMELGGRTMLVVGLGGIGTQVAKRAHGLGMRVIATRGSRREGPDYVDYVGLSHEVTDLAREADVVVNATPLTEQTRGMFDKAFFEAMKPTAFFISVGRGASTVTDDLIEALENNDIAGAGLDVTDPEPLPAGHLLWSTPRVIITPHTAGRGDKGRDRLFLMVRENLRRYVAGEPMLSVVNVERGY